MRHTAGRAHKPAVPSAGGEGAVAEKDIEYLDVYVDKNDRKKYFVPLDRL